ncbi:MULTISPECIES: DUF1330 domain-containing protein [Chelativorans]|jgi:uncharacterized protein (DUF1330 family)|uniref:DUF1330 domain-containing protein n=1 Tax=Chelativorans sp. (strain BNC1) TaxID=266779 RepID=Q11E97_CHESB|nr:MULTISPECIES: DUF1330 domain-containing protein [Chelativorans]
MPVYWIGRANVVDEEPMQEYHRLTELALQKYPNRTTLVRGGKFKLIEGVSEFNRFVIHEYRSMDEALEFYYSEEYQRAVPFRMLATKGQSNLILVEGPGK